MDLVLLIGESGVSRVTEPSLPHALWSFTPPDVRDATYPLRVKHTVAFMHNNALGIRKSITVSRLHSPRLMRLPTYASDTALPLYPQGLASGPAGLDANRVGLAPTGRQIEFQTAHTT